MSIHGPGLLESDQAAEEFSAIAFLVSDRLEEELDRLENGEKIEQVVTALILCLRLMADEYKGPIQIVVLHRQFKSWESRFFSWFESVRTKLPGQDIDRMEQTFREEFSRFEKLVDTTLNE